MDLETLKQRVFWFRVVFFGIVAGACVWGYLSCYESRAGYEPQHFGRPSAAALMRTLSREKRPVLVFFYHKNNSSISRALLPVLDQLVSDYRERVPFYEYRLTDRDPEKFKSYQAYDGIVVIFRDGREAKRIDTFYIKKRDNINMMVSALEGFESHDDAF